MKIVDQKGRRFKQGQIIRVFHYVGPRRKKEYMYKQIAILKDRVFAYHLPLEHGQLHSGYWVESQADDDGVARGHLIVQCYCDDCIWNKGCK